MTVQHAKVIAIKLLIMHSSFCFIMSLIISVHLFLMTIYLRFNVMLLFCTRAIIKSIEEFTDKLTNCLRSQGY